MRQEESDVPEMFSLYVTERACVSGIVSKYANTVVSSGASPLPSERFASMNKS